MDALIQQPQSPSTVHEFRHCVQAGFPLALVELPEHGEGTVPLRITQTDFKTHEVELLGLATFSELLLDAAHLIYLRPVHH